MTCTMLHLRAGLAYRAVFVRGRPPNIGVLRVLSLTTTCHYRSGRIPLLPDSALCQALCQPPHDSRILVQTAKSILNGVQDAIRETYHPPLPHLLYSRAGSVFHLHQKAI